MMKRIKLQKNNQNILDVLYQEEALNLFLIHYIENRLEDLGELYIYTSKNQVKGILHIKNDGNSNFTSFYAYSNRELKLIAKQLKKIDKPNILLAGKPKDIYQILEGLKISKKLELNNYYVLNRNLFEKINLDQNIKLLKANNNEIDKNIIKKYLIDFFEPKTGKDIEALTNNQKVLEDLKNGVYFLMNPDGQKIGMSRFSGYSKNYIDITTVYVEKTFRGHGYGKELMKLMVKEALDMGKLPVVQTSVNNDVAKSIYESIGFEKISDYAFDFISDR